MNMQKNGSQETALLEALKKSGLDQELENVQALSNYVNSVEGKLFQMMEELQLLHQEMKSFHDKSLAGRCANLVSFVEEQIQQTRNMVQESKKDFFQECSRAVKAIREKDYTALRQAMQDMKIALECLRDGFHRSVWSMGGAARRMDKLRGRIHTSGNYLNRAMRTLTGRQPQTAAELGADKGTIAKMRSACQRFEKTFAAMERSADVLLIKLEPQRKTPEVTPEHCKEEASMQFTLEQAKEIMKSTDGNLYLLDTPITCLPDNLTVPGNLCLIGTPIKTLPNNLTVGSELNLISTPITALPDNLTIGGGLDLRGTPITSLPDKLKIGGTLNLFGSLVTSLPDNLTIPGSLILGGTPIKTLPDNLTVGGDLDLRGTQITSLPDNLIVGGRIYPETLQYTSPCRILNSLDKLQKTIPGRPASVPVKMLALER